MAIKKGGYEIADVYPGGFNSLDNNSSEFYTGYRTNAGKIGLSTDPRTANVLKEFSDKIGPGEKTIELSIITPEVMDTIPKQHLKEIHRLSKLTGVDVTIHGPLAEASGLSREGFTEGNREVAERQMLRSVDQAHEINPDGNSTVTFHSASMIPATEYRKLSEKEGGGEEIEKLYIIDRATGQINVTKKDERFFPHLNEKGEPIKMKHSAEEQLNIMNSSQWDDSLTQLITPIERTNKMIEETYPNAAHVLGKLSQGVKIGDLTQTELAVYDRYKNAEDSLGDIQKHVSSLYDKAYKYASSDAEKRELEKFAQTFTEITEKNPGDIIAFSRGIQKLRSDLTKVKPKLFEKLNDFAIKESVKTFGNVAYEAYQKYKDKAPIISIENPPAPMNAFSRGEDLKKMVEDSRKQFVDRATADGKDKKWAEKEAEKLIGVTWDVGHINQLRRFGFTKEDVIKETKHVAPYLKHVHLSDNFGVENTELPMGMGNVPLKEMMDQLGERGKTVKKIVEAGNWWQHFQTNPMRFSYESVGSPIYSMKMGPYWNQLGGGSEAGYFGGYGPTLPQINYETFGTGFSQLPSELGGSRPGGRGARMGGSPLE